jgi:hypothetical protein
MPTIMHRKSLEKSANTAKGENPGSQAAGLRFEKVYARRGSRFLKQGVNKRGYRARLREDHQNAEKNEHKNNRCEPELLPHHQEFKQFTHRQKI